MGMNAVDVRREAADEYFQGLRQFGSGVYIEICGTVR